MASTIKYIINLMLENRSYDQILGYRDPNINTYINYYEGNAYPASPIPYFNGEGYGRFCHEATMYAINTPCQDKMIPNQGFVYANKSYSYMPIANNPNPPEMVMGHFPAHPLYDHFINNYTLCDNYFSSVPGQTDPNRFFSLSATSHGQVNDYFYSFDPTTMFPQTQPTIITKLIENGHQAKIYANTNTPEALLLLNHLAHVDSFLPMNQFFKDVASNSLPFFSYLEPAYERTNVTDRNTDQYEFQLVESVYNALRQHPDIWNHCVFILNFDEHGGYHDHVHPPQTVAPDGNTSLFNFEQYGVRVPCFIISPLVGQGIDSTVYDHTSVLATIEKIAGVAPLTRRDACANDFLHLFDKSAREIEIFSDVILDFPQPVVIVEDVAEWIAVLGVILWRLYETEKESSGKGTLFMETMRRVVVYSEEEMTEYILDEAKEFFGKLKERMRGKTGAWVLSKDAIIHGLLTFFEKDEGLAKYGHLLYHLK